MKTRPRCFTRYSTESDIESKILDWQYAMILQNQLNIASWRRKMTCLKAVESVGEYGSYPDLRTPQQRVLWLRIRIQVKAIRALFLLEEGPDTFDESHRP